MLPFTSSDFFAVFARYNQNVWPLQLLFLAAAVASVFAARRGGASTTRVLLSLLAALWLWMGVVYHGVYFRQINPAAVAFAVLFIAEGVLLIVATVRTTVTIQPRSDAAGATGLALIVLALIVYPAVGHLLGHRYPANPTFGLPCPTTIFTLGVLHWARPLKASLLVIPLLWAAIGVSAAITLRVYEDTGLLLAGIAALVTIYYAKRPSIPQRVAA